MIGQHSGNQDRLFYSFNLDEHVPTDHMLRGIDRYLDLADLRQHLAPGQPHRSPLSGPRVDDPDAAGRLLLWYPLRETVVRRSAFEPRVSLVLSARAGRQSS